MQKSKDKSNIAEIMKGSLTGVLVLAATVIGAVILLLKSGVSQSAYMPILLVVSMLVGLMSGFAGTRKYRKNGLTNGLASAVLPTFLLFLAITAAQKGFNALQFIPMAAMLATGAIGGIAAVNIKRKKKKRAV